MILTCPACSANYMVANEALGEQGRDVRCVKCSHVWFQKSEKQHLDELITKIQAESPHDDIGFDAAELQKQQAATSTTKTRPQNKKTTNKNKTIKKKSHVFVYLETLLKSPKFAGIMAGVAAFSLILFALIMAQPILTKAIPATEKLYDIIGLGSEPAPPAEPLEHMIHLERVSLSYPDGGKGVPSVTGMLINLTARPVKIPSFEIMMFDSHDKQLGTMIIAPPKESLEKEESLDLELKLPHELHTGATRMDIKFRTETDTAKEAAPHH